MKRWIAKQLDRIIAWGHAKSEALGGPVRAEAVHTSTISAVVTRADGTVEDHGVVTRATITRGGKTELNK